MFTRKLSALLLLLSVITLSHANPGTKKSNRHAHDKWISTWYSAIDTKGPTLEPLSIRQRLRTSLGGTKLRLHFSNQYGASPLRLQSVFIARSKNLQTIETQSQKPVLFANSASVTIPAGGEIVSDPIDFKALPLEELSVSFYLPTGSDHASLHNTSMQNAQLVAHLDKSRDAEWQEAKLDDTRYFLKELEVLSGTKAGVIAVLGDSLTDGVGIENDRYQRWTDFLAERLQASKKTKELAVVNAGIAGNRFLKNASAPFIGQAGITRFAHDVLQRTGLKTVIVSIGTNDISANNYFKDPKEIVSFEEIIEGYRSLIKQAHARGLKIIAASIKPRGGAQGLLPHTAQAEELRMRINRWMRESNEFDGIIDFDLALRDPNQLDRLAQALDSGDHTHPNAEGYRRMAQAIDLALFR